jgi:hypothetical protein
MGVAKRIKQSLYIAPAARTQYTFKIQRVHFANALISGASPQSQFAPTDRLGPRFTLERQTIGMTSGKRPYEIP